MFKGLKAKLNDSIASNNNNDVSFNKICYLWCKERRYDFELLKKIIAQQNEVFNSYYRVRSLYFLAVIFTANISYLSSQEPYFMNSL